MAARIDEIADSIFRISVFVPEIGPPAGFTFNSFLVIDDEPLLFHAGQRRMFPLFSAAVASLMPVEQLPVVPLEPVLDEVPATQQCELASHW